MRRTTVIGVVAGLALAVSLAPAHAANFDATVHLLKDINPGSGDSATVTHTQFVARRGVALGSKLIFGADDGSGAAVWVTDGTSAGTHQVSTAVSDPYDFTVFAGKVYFQGDGQQGVELWETDGTEQGTQQVYNINPALSGNDSSNPRDLTVVGNYLYFTAEPVGSGQELWRYAAPPQIGPPAPPQLITSFGGSVGIQNLARFGNKVVFSADPNNTGFEPWISDGTPGAGHTFMLKNIASTNASSNPDHFTTVGSTVFFAADDTSGLELWKSDGTTPGTTLAADVWPGATSSSPHDLFALGSKLLFSATSPTAGTNATWVYNGTLSQLKVNGDNLRGGGTGNNPTGWTSYQGYVYFSGSDQGDSLGSELYRTKGVPGDVRLVKSINPGNSNSSPQEFRVVGPSLFFQATDAAHGPELWRTDGTAAGTKLVKDIYPGATGSGPQVLGVLNGTLFVQAGDNVHGEEPWVFTARATTTKGYPKSSYSKAAAHAKHLHLTIKVTTPGYVPTGTVLLKHGATLVGTGTLTNGAVSIHITVALPKGVTYLRAYYVGNAGASSSRSARIKLVVK